MTSALVSFLHARRIAASTALVIATIASAAHAGTINVVNGSFSDTLKNKSSEFGDRYSSQQVTGWTTSGYNFVFQSPLATAVGEYSPVKLDNKTISSPDGGNFIALNGGFKVGALEQTLYGLTPGVSTIVSFYFAGTQQEGFVGDTKDYLSVSLGGQTDVTPTISVANAGFTGWYQENLAFTPTSASAVLSFLAHGTPSGDPPNVLLDGVSVSQSTSPVPEPGSLALLGTGLAGAGSMLRSRLKRKS